MWPANGRKPARIKHEVDLVFNVGDQNFLAASQRVPPPVLADLIGRYEAGDYKKALSWYKAAAIKAVARLTKTNVSAGGKSMLAAAGAGDTQLLKRLIKNGASVNVRGKKNTTPLMEAVYPGSIGAVEILLNAGADPNAQDDNGTTALMQAVGINRSPHLRIAMMLLKKGANPNICARLGKTALMLAAAGGNGDGIKLLLDNGAVIDATTTSKHTALDLASKLKRSEAVKVLMASGAKRGKPGKPCSAL